MSKTLSDLYLADPDACYRLCEAAALSYSAEACRQGNSNSPFLTNILVADAKQDAKRNGRKVA